MHDRDLHANILGISAPWQFSDVVLDVAAGTVEVFVEHHGVRQALRGRRRRGRSTTRASQRSSRRS
jgi:hypothetical protein